jgi:hypothetical protein
MKADPELPLRQTIKDLIQAGARLASELRTVAYHWPEPTPYPPRVLHHQIELWNEAVARAIDLD